jgi:ParB family chromosome partitioning protein
VVPEAAAAYQILAMNTEKAHNLREKSLEVIRMYKELARLDDATEEIYALEFEEPAFITLVSAMKSDLDSAAGPTILY